jgi:hypothetical protein
MATYTSVQSGDWTTPATWGEAVLYPGDGDRAVISNGDTVEIDTDITVGDSPANHTTDVIAVQAGGVLKWKNSAGSRTLTVKGNIGIARLGRFEIGSSTTPIPDTRIATLYFPTDLGPTNGWIIDNQGEFEVCGSRYHMGSDDSYQRTKLESDITANPGNQVSFDTEDPVDWTTGDTVWFGTGADPTQAVTACEQVTITKTDSDTYTADFANDHHAGDFIIHATRNVILQGDDNTKGVQIVCTLESNDGSYVDDLVLNMQWCYLSFFGYSNTVASAAIQFIPSNAGAVKQDWECHIPVDAVILKNIVIDKGAYTSVSFTTGGLYIDTELDFQDTSKFIDEVHCWLQQHRFAMVGWDINIGHITCLESNQGIYGYGWGSLHIDGFWYVFRGSGAGHGIEGRVRKLENFEIHRCYSGALYLDSPYAQAMLEREEFINGKVYHAGSTTQVHLLNQRRTNLYFENVEFVGSHGSGTTPSSIVRIEQSGPIVFRNCAFDGNRSGNYGAINIMSTNNSDLYFYNCTFGTIVRNASLNVGTEYLATIGVGRIRFEDCTFKKPLNPDADQPYFTDVFRWIVTVDYTNAGQYYYQRTRWGACSTVEIVNCQVLDASDVDQWPNRYPNVTRLAFVTGGSEVRDELTELIDGSFGAKLLPFSPSNPNWINNLAPVKIPVSSGETVTAKLSFKRNAYGDHDQPGLKLNGCGIFEEEYLTASDPLNTWTEVTISGTATYEGTVELFISAGTNIRKSSLTKYYQDTFYQPPQPVPPDWDDMFGVVVYADGLDITVN